MDHESTAWRPPQPHSNVDIGATLGERYELRRRLALTGLSAVYRAVDQPMRRIVVVKLARARPAARDPYAVSRACLLREAHMLRLLAQHGLPAPQLIELCAWAERPFLAMSYIPGHSLDTLLQFGWISERRAAEAIASAAGLLARVHRLGYVHHDAKPANIHVRPDGSAVLLDWGAAQALDDPCAPQALTLTPDFASWNQIRGEVRRSNDVYALGRTLDAAVVAARPAVRSLIDGAIAARGARPMSMGCFAHALGSLLAADRLLHALGRPALFRWTW